MATRRVAAAFYLVLGFASPGVVWTASCPRDSALRAADGDLAVSGSQSLWLVQRTSASRRPPAPSVQAERSPAPPENHREHANASGSAVVLRPSLQEKPSAAARVQNAIDPHPAMMEETPTVAAAVQNQTTAAHPGAMQETNSVPAGVQNASAAHPGAAQERVLATAQNATATHPGATTAQGEQLLPELAEVPPDTLAALAALQAASTARVQGSSKRMDYQDGSIIFYCMAMLLFMYGVAGVLMGIDSGNAAGEVSMAESLRRAMSARWAIPQPGVVEEALPTLCGAVVAQTLDVPLLVPIKDLADRLKPKELGWFSAKPPSDIAWSMDIKGSAGEKLFCAQQLKSRDGQLGAVEVRGRHGGRAEKVLARVDPSLTLFDGGGQKFGQLVLKQSGAYELKESTGRHRWLITPSQDDLLAFTVTWRPHRRVLASVLRGTHSHAGYLKVMNAPGVDAVLILICTLGLIAFRIDAPMVSAGSDDDDPPEAAPAASLLSRPFR